MNFKSAKELLDLCFAGNCLISDVMLERECTEGEKSREDVLGRMARALEIMKQSARAAVEKPSRSMGGLIGGEAKALNGRLEAGSTVCGSVMTRAMMVAMGVLEVNANMGLIVAAPTAGSSGVVPGVLLALQEEYGFSDDRLVKALFTAGALGYIAMRNTTVAGAVGGCQAEVGVASSMAAASAVELLGGSPEQSLHAASTVLMNMLGLVCDPVAGLVEYPCQNRNAAGVANALAAVEITMAGIRQHIPFDEMLDIMFRVGKKMPPELRETALGGCALSSSACSACVCSIKR